MQSKQFIKKYLDELLAVVDKTNYINLNNLIDRIVRVKSDKGRILFLGVGGSAANCSHAVNDFRKIAKIECYTPSDNVSELTANTNDEGWDMVFLNWLKINNLKKKDLIFVFSVGGGNKKYNVSVNLISAIDYAIKKNCDVACIVGKEDGYAAKKSKFPILLPNIKTKTFLTPFAESYQSIIWHLIVTHPKIQKNKTKW
jgi:D-sedoheptulose 7-phosphate isomerase